MTKYEVQGRERAKEISADTARALDSKFDLRLVTKFMMVLSRSFLSSSWKLKACYATIPRRAFASSITAVDLEYDLHAPSGSSTHTNTRKDVGGPLVILHGLLVSGSKRNWKSLAKAFSRELHRPVYTLDLRNQGSSPHVPGMTYLHMAADVLHFCETHKLKNVSLMGHSMGGKVAMTFALNPALPTSLLSNLIVVDIAPSIGSISDEFMGYIDAMRAIEAEGFQTRKEADALLQKWEKDPSIRAFLLTNFIPGTTHSPHEIGSFPYKLGERTWEGNTLFIKGQKSKYINRHNIHTLKEYFPNMELEKLDTGHWVHAEDPHNFRILVANFLNKHSNEGHI
ncbi:AB hydrolase superfamily protein [Pleurotus pulmonarius]